MTDPHKLISQVPFPWQIRAWEQLAKQVQNQQLAHAFLICGEQGIGKALFVHKFARLLLCQQPTDTQPCGNCQNCQLGGDVYHPDIQHLKPEEGARDIKIEQVRALSQFASTTSHSGIAKIAIIEQAHRMNASSANALLKTLEEPAGKTYLFLISELPGFLSATIRSRCQRLLIPTPSLSACAHWLSERIPAGIDGNYLASVAGARPLHGLELAVSGAIEEREKFIAKLGQLGAGKVATQSVVALAAKIGEVTAIGYLAATSSILIKSLVTRERPEADAELDALYQRLVQVEGEVAGSPANGFDRRRLLNLLHYYEDVQKARRQLLSAANPNPQLVMESLLWRWSELS